MRGKIVISLLGAGLVLAAALAIRYASQREGSPLSEATDNDVSPKTTLATNREPLPTLPLRRLTQQTPSSTTHRRPSNLPSSILTEPDPISPDITDKVERLQKIREKFRELAIGDRATALRTAKRLTLGTEREAALLTLVTEWTHGELSDPQMRARNISMYGIEAGVGMELAKDPDLAQLWANQLTTGPGRVAMTRTAAVAMLDSDPSAAFALSSQLPEKDQAAFFASVFAEWAIKDTDAALQYAGQFQDPADRDAALKAIRGTAPVGIGAALATQDGYPVVGSLVKGAPADLSGQLHEGDRIVGLALGDGAFVVTRGLPLQDIVNLVRGEPGTSLQLQVLAANAPEGSQPRTVSLIRDQIKYKR